MKKTKTAPSNIVADIGWILDYLESYEFHAFIEDGEPDGHIYQNIKRVRQWQNEVADNELTSSVCQCCSLNNGGVCGKK